MSIQQIPLHIILITFILLFILLLANFEYGLGPIKLRPKDIKKIYKIEANKNIKILTSEIL